MLSAKYERRVNKQLALIDNGAPMSGDTEKRLASIWYVKADYTSGIGLTSTLLGVVSLFISIGTTEVGASYSIFAGTLAVGLFLVAVAANWKLFHTDTAKHVAFAIHQQRSADLKSRADIAEILAAIEEPRKIKVFQEPDISCDARTNDLNTKLWLSLLAVVSIASRKRRN